MVANGKESGYGHLASSPGDMKSLQGLFDVARETSAARGRRFAPSAMVDMLKIGTSRYHRPNRGPLAACAVSPGFCKKLLTPF